METTTIKPPREQAPVRGTLLREYLARRFMSQARVAQAAGYDHRYANKVLRGVLAWDETLYRAMLTIADVPRELAAIWDRE